MFTAGAWTLRAARRSGWMCASGSVLLLELLLLTIGGKTSEGGEFVPLL